VGKTLQTNKTRVPQTGQAWECSQFTHWLSSTQI